MLRYVKIWLQKLPSTFGFLYDCFLYLYPDIAEPHIIFDWKDAEKVLDLGAPSFRTKPMWMVIITAPRFLLVSLYQRHPGWEWNSRNPISSPLGSYSEKHLLGKVVARSKRGPVCMYVYIYTHIKNIRIYIYNIHSLPSRGKTLGNPEIHCFLLQFVRLLMKV